jgi:phosphatidylserine synthase
MTVDRPAPVSLRAVPVSLRAAAALVAAEGVAAGVAATAFAVAAFTGHPADRATTLTLAAVLLVLAAGVVVVARALRRGRPAAATPAYLAQFFTLVVAWYQRHTLLAVTVVLAVVALATVVALSAPESRAALRRGRDEHD